jgi:hypothetical protein
MKILKSVDLNYENMAPSSAVNKKIRTETVFLECYMTFVCSRMGMSLEKKWMKSKYFEVRISRI